MGALVGLDGWLELPAAGARRPVRAGWLGRHVQAVTQAGRAPVGWNEIGRGLQLLRQGQEVEYLGLSGPLQFDQFGEAPETSTAWWTIVGDSFQDTPAQSDCR